MDLKEEDILGDYINQHWYYTTKSLAMLDYLSGIKAEEVLDVGAGSGIFSKKLIDHDFCKRAVCVDPNYETEHEETYRGCSIKYLRSTSKNTQSLVLMMDVLEHVENDVELIREYTNGISPGSHLLITVPAFKFMWSGHDVFLGHYRRYTLKHIKSVAMEAGMTPIKTNYFFGSLFPIVASVRILKHLRQKKGQLEPKSELKKYSPWLNETLKLIHNLERKSIFKINKLAGLSLFCLCTKK